MRVALVQTRSGVSIEENVGSVEAQIRQAAGEGAVYIQTPEMTGILQKRRKLFFSEIKEQSEDKLVKRASELAAELGIWLHIGSQAIKLSETMAANRAFVFAPDGLIVTTYDKIHMFDVDLDNGESWRESSAFEPGTLSPVINLAGVKTGVSICYDLRFPHLFRNQALCGAQILTIPAAFTRQTGEAHWHVLLRARAIENGAFVLASAQGGVHEDGRETYGHSLIINPWGKIIAEIENDEPNILVADIDPEEVGKARAKIPNLANSREFVLQDATDNREAAE